MKIRLFILLRLWKFRKLLIAVIEMIFLIFAFISLLNFIFQFLGIVVATITIGSIILSTPLLSLVHSCYILCSLISFYPTRFSLIRVITISVFSNHLFLLTTSLSRWLSCYFVILKWLEDLLFLLCLFFFKELLLYWNLVVTRISWRARSE